MKPVHDKSATDAGGKEKVAGRKANRLIGESSPYLLQHAYNPVDWNPWDDEAIARARRENKPIFLSIGYSTCHWCHVMERESFEDPAIAAILNQYFVCIKVDREERPDLDQVYMAVTLAMTGSGGWPMSVFLTPELKPFFAGTYFPPQSAFGRPGFADLLQKIHLSWEKDHEMIVKKSDELLQHLVESQASSDEKKLVVEATSAAAAEQLTRGYDAQNGGFGNAPKFPRPAGLAFLLRYGQRTGDSRVLDMVFVTLRKMAAGGLWDQLGGGFHRYSVDAGWRVPHFEKMLYDQAQLATLYLEAAQLSRDPLFKEVAAKTLDYVLASMRDEAGGFYSAEDADSPKPDNPKEQQEGAYYVWTAAELNSFLTEEEGAMVRYRYGIVADGNVADDPHGELRGKNILYLAHDFIETAKHFSVDENHVRTVLIRAEKKMLTERGKRPRPHLDDKVLASWNGLMISALAKGALVLGQERYLHAAERAGKFIRTTLIDSGKNAKDTSSLRVWRRYRNGTAGISGHLDDYAFTIQGFLDLYEASSDWHWLELALALTEVQNSLFKDDKKGGFFETTGKDQTVIMRMKSDYDGAEPAGNSVSAMNFARLGRIFGDKILLEQADQTMNFFAGKLHQSPGALPQMLSAGEFLRRKPMQIVIAGDRGAGDTKAMLQVVAEFFLPNKVVLFNDGTPMPESLAGKLSSLAYMVKQSDKATAYVCENFACQQPITEVETLRTMLGQ
ncbi:MAG: thioredoxin domain-containing protein [Proteobacteria bacterium]|nr:thioredoxin domain-containing protein [Desulfobulbaceae bacterium]MBU4151366.1 thioredoxin domain-containing protein [Pseudomonadota bacterium]